MNHADFSDENKIPQLMTGLKTNIQEFQQVAGEVMVTELDVRMDNLSALPPQTQLEIQSRAYQSIVTNCLDAGVKSICVLGISDRHSWLAQNTPLLFDSTLNPKPAYFAMLDVLKKFAQQKKP